MKVVSVYCMVKVLKCIWQVYLSIFYPHEIVTWKPKKDDSDVSRDVTWTVTINVTQYCGWQKERWNECSSVIGPF